MFSPTEIARQRMVNQRVWGKPFDSHLDVVPVLGAVQAQEFPYAKWSVAQRSGSTESAVHDAVADGSILRTHVMRPTWHFVAREDILWMLELTASRVNAVMMNYYRVNGLEDFSKTNALFVSALKGGQHLDRKEMRAVLEKSGMTVTNLQLGFILMRAELDAVICSGAPRGKQQTYALLEERANPVAPARGALAELVYRYFTTRGPATLKDFSWWSGLTQADGRRGVEMVEEISHAVVNGRTYFYGELTPRVELDSPRVDLLQVYDELGMAYTESRDVMLVDGLERPQPAYYHSIVLDGQLIGHWRRTIKGKEVTFETQLFRRLKKAESTALEAAMDRYRLAAGGSA